MKKKIQRLLESIINLTTKNFEIGDKTQTEKL